MPAETLATDDGAVFLKERLDELGKRRGQLEAGLDEVLLATEDIEKEAVDQSLVTEALANFSEVFEHIPPYQQRELMRLVLYKAVVSHDHMELALYGRPPELSEMTQNTARFQTSDWLPGLVSQSVLLWDRVRLAASRSARGRGTLRLQPAA